MSRRPWLSFGFFVPMLAALLLVIAVSCGGGATSTAAPQPESVAPAAEPTAPTATPVPVAVAADEPEVVTTGAEPYGTLNSSFVRLGVFSTHPRWTAGGNQSLARLPTHESLFRMDIDSQFQGLMVEDWSIAPDNRTWTFKLHKGINFSGGWGEVTPEDIIYSLREFGAEGNSCGCDQTQAMFNNPDGYFVGLDNYTLELDTVVPTWDLLSWMNQPNCCSAHVMSKKQWFKLLETETQDEAIQHLVGTGPFELTEARTGEFWTFKAVPDHWRKVPEFAELKFLDIPEEATSLANFLTGKIDIWRASPDSLAVVGGEADTKFMSQGGAGELSLNIWGNFYEYVGTDEERYFPDKPWVSSNPDLDSPEWENARKVRQAIGLAIDRDKLVEGILGGEGEPGSMVGWQAFKSQWPAGFAWEYDVERAKQLLKEAGYEDGFDIQLTAADTGSPTVVIACDAIGDMLADINLNVTMRRIGLGALYDEYKARSVDGLTCHSLPSFMEPIALHKIIYDPTVLWGMGFDHPWYTERLTTAFTTFDRDERWELQLEMAAFIRENAFDIGVYGSNNVYPLGPKLDSWEEHLSMGDPRQISNLEFAIHRR